MSENSAKLPNQPVLSESINLDNITNPTKRPPLILCIETSGRVGSVALARGEKLLAEKSFSAPFRHSAELFPTSDRLCRQFECTPDQISQVYLSIGPGSFTGLRIAVTAAKMLHLANNARIVPVDTLDVIAENLNAAEPKKNRAESTIAVLLDAKRGQFFTAVYRAEKGKWKKILPDCLMTPSQLLAQFAQENPISLLGEGLLYHADSFNSPTVRILDKTTWFPKASKVHLLGLRKAQKHQFADALTLSPLYLRRPEAEEKWHNRPAKKQTR
jgi:tRNA threonylcarbamoyladenosine biosynthesis protein TsaB